MNDPYVDALSKAVELLNDYDPTDTKFRWICRRFLSDYLKMLTEITGWWKDYDHKSDVLHPGTYLGRTDKGCICIAIIVENNHWVYEVTSKLPYKLSDLIEVMEVSCQRPKSFPGPKNSQQSTDSMTNTMSSTPTEA